MSLLILVVLILVVLGLGASQKAGERQKQRDIIQAAKRAAALKRVRANFYKRY